MNSSTPKLIEPIGHVMDIKAVDFSPNGKYLLTGSVDGTAKLWDTKGHELCTYEEHLVQGGVTAVAFSPANEQIATCGFDRKVVIWNYRTGERLYILEFAENHTPKALAFSPDAMQLLIGGDNGSLGLWKIPEGAQAEEELAQIADFSEIHSETINDIAFSPRGDKIASTSKTGAFLKMVEEGTSLSIQSDEYIRSLAFSPDGSQIVSGSNTGKLSLWKVSSGELILNFEHQHDRRINSVAFSVNGLIASASSDHQVILWESMGSAWTRLEKHNSPVSAVVFSPNGQFLLSGSNGNRAILWNVEKRKPLVELLGYSDPILSARFSPKGTEILAGPSRHFAFSWDLDDGELSPQSLPLKAGARTLGYSFDGSLLITGSDDEKIRIWDVNTKEKLKEYDQHDGRLYSVSISGNNRFVVSGAADGTVRVWELDGGDDPIFILRHEDEVRSAVISPENNYILSGTKDGKTFLWDLEKKDDSGVPSSQLIDQSEEAVRALAFSRDGHHFINTSSQNSIKLWDTRSRKVIQVLEGQHQNDIYSLAFSPDNQRILSGSKDKSAILWNLKGKKLHHCFGHKSTVSTVDFSPLGGYILTGSHDCQLKIWDNKTGKEVASLVHIGNIDWVVHTPEGLFDASPGAMKLMHYVIGQEVIELNQLKERYWQPGLLKILLHFSQNELRDVEAFEEVPLYPEILYMEINDDNELLLKIKPRNGGIGRISFRINGKEKAKDIRDIAELSEKNGDFLYKLKLNTLAFEKFYGFGKNTVSIRCWNEDEWLPSAFHELTVSMVRGRGLIFGDYEEGEGEEDQQPVSFYTLLIGTSSYQNEHLSLRFPDDDANFLHNALKIVGENLFGDYVNHQLLTTELPSSNTFSSKENIKKAFEKIAKSAESQDVLLIYFSGHGANFDNGRNAQYYYLTEATVSDNLSDPKVRERSTISSDELTDWIKEIPARKQVLIFDTCYAGNVLNDLMSRRTKQSTQERALERMKDRTGMYVITGSSADKVSYEASNYGQGLLTYSLLVGMKGGALFRQINQTEQTVDVMTLFTFAREEVERLAKEFMATQKPTVRVPAYVESFDIGIVTERAKNLIRIATPKPVFQQCQFMNEDSFLDNLGISSTLDLYLAGSIGIGNRPKAIFIGVSDYPGAHTVRGLYTESENGLRVKGKVFKDQKSEGEFIIEANSMEEAVPKIARRVEQITFFTADHYDPSDEEIQVLDRGRKEDLEALKGKPGYGYDPGFIGEDFEVSLPELSAFQKEDIVRPNEEEETLNYQYFSVLQSKSRKFPYFAACNLDGGKFRKLSRSGSFIRDTRIADEDQWRDNFYKFKFDGIHRYTTIFDRGHMAKREDTQWGDSDEEAKRGASLTFFFTNALPQHSHLNGVVWRGLEDYIMDVATHGKKLDEEFVYKINILTGPVFQKDDPKLPIAGDEWAQIPVLFWKIIYYRKKSDNNLYYVGFLMGQNTLLKEAFTDLNIIARDAEAGDPPFEGYKDKEVYQVKVSFIEELTGMSFHLAIDPIAGNAGGRQITEVIKTQSRDISGKAEGVSYRLDGIIL